MPKRNVKLSEQQAAFIRQSVEKGRYQDASEVIRAGLRLLEYQERQDKLKIKALRRLATDAFGEIDRGEFTAVDPRSLDAFLAGVSAKARASKA